MLNYELLATQGILKVSPAFPLASRDIVQMGESIDRYLSDHPRLNGILVQADDLLGWDDFSSQISHLELAKDHQLQADDTLQSDDLEQVIKEGTDSLGIYYNKKTLAITKDKQIGIQDLGILMYYHNKLKGYELENYISS